MGARARFERLLEAGVIGSLHLRNRLIMPAMCDQLCGVWGDVTNAEIEWFARRARGGAGLLIVPIQATTLDPVRAVQLLRADDDCYTPGLYRLAEAVHDAGSKIAAQLSPGPGAQGGHGLHWALGLQHIQEVQPIGPSEVPSPLAGVVPRKLKISEIEKIVEMCGWAAARVKQARFDAIEIHAHGGYLIAEFMSAYFNKRADRYGGDLKGRLRFLLEIINSMRKHVGPGFPIIVRYSIDEFMEGGRDLKESQVVAKHLQDVGVNAIDVSSGVYGAKLPSTPPMYYPEGCFVYFGEALKAVVDIPIIVAGRLGNPFLAEQVLQENKADFIGLGRPLIADPDWPRKVAEGRIEEILNCIACNECRENLMRKQPIRCTVNAVAGREGQYDVIKPAEKVKRIMVIGAGPAGMEVARVAGLRGHDVTVCEVDKELRGGQLWRASIPPHKESLREIAKYYSVVLGRLGNVRLELGKEMTVDAVVAAKPEAVVVATGGTPLIPDIPGVDKTKVVTALSVLDGTSDVGQTVVVVGGTSIGCETANFLAGQKKAVTIVEVLDAAGTDVEKMSWLALQRELSEKGVSIMTGTRVKEITDDGVVVDCDSKVTSLKADTVVLAIGFRSLNQLAESLRDFVAEVHTIGDAKEPRRIRDAVSDGFIVGHGI